MKKLLLLFLLCSSAFAETIDLNKYEASFYSQNGEDGVIAKLIRLIQPEKRFCVELGANDGITDSNTYLLRRQGWDCLLLDPIYEMENWKLFQENFTAENINAILAKYDVPHDFAVLSIQSDSSIWRAMDSVYKPAIVIVKGDNEGANGYSLVYVEKTGKSHFFVRDEFLRKL